MALSLISRLERLEKVIEVKAPRPTLVYVHDPLVSDGEQQRRAIAEFKAGHPGWRGNEFSFICAVSQKCKELVLRLLNGEGPANN